MSTREYESGGKLIEQVKSDNNYAVLRMDNDLLFVPADAVEELPPAGAQMTVAEREYQLEVQEKQAADVKAALQKR